MALVRELAETGRRIRIDAQRRQRLPCAEGWIVAGPNLEAYHDLLCEELNVESISVETDLDRFQQVDLVSTSEHSLQERRETSTLSLVKSRITLTKMHCSLTFETVHATSGC